MAAQAYRAIYPHSPEVYERGTVSIKEAATQTFVKGALLIYSSGYVTEASTAPATITYIAAEAGHNTTSNGDKECICWPIVPGDLWYVTLKDALAQTDLGSNYGLVRDSTTKFWYLDTADTGDQMTVKSFVSGPGQAVLADTKCYVLATFDSANIGGI